MIYNMQILSAIAERLLAPGNCPYDGTCIYSETHCTAPTSFILMARKNHLEHSKERNPEAYGGFIMGGSVEDFSEHRWPCTSFAAILFASPAALEKRREGARKSEGEIIDV